MKNRIFAVLLSLAMIFTIVPAYALADSALIIAAESVTAELKAGTEISVPVKAISNSGFAVGNVDIAWDSTALKLKSVTYSEIAPDASSAEIGTGGKYRVCFGSQLAKENITQTGTLFTLNFVVESTAKAGDYAIALEKASVYTADMNATATELVSGTVTLTGEASTDSLALEIGSANAVLGESSDIKIPVTAKQNPGFGVGTVDLLWDSSALTLKKVEFSEIAPDSSSAEIVSDGNYRIAFGNQLSATDQKGTGVLFTIVFTVNEGAKAGEYKLVLGNPTVYSAALNKVPVTIKSGKITLSSMTESTTSTSATTSAATTTSTTATAATTTSSVTTVSATATSSATAGTATTTTVTVTTTATVPAETTSTQSVTATTSTAASVTTSATTDLTATTSTTATAAPTTTSTATASATTASVTVTTTTVSVTSATTTASTVSTTSTAATTTVARMSVSINKVDDAGVKLAGAKLQLSGVKPDGTTPIQFTADCIQVGEGGELINGVGTQLVWLNGANASLVFAEDGTYTLHELVAPVGYYLASDITFVVGGGKIIIGGADASEIKMIDVKETTTSTSTTASAIVTTTTATAADSTTTTASTTAGTTTATASNTTATATTTTEAITTTTTASATTLQTTTTSTTVAITTTSVQPTTTSTASAQTTTSAVPTATTASTTASVADTTTTTASAATTTSSAADSTTTTETTASSSPVSTTTTVSVTETPSTTSTDSTTASATALNSSSTSASTTGSVTSTTASATETGTSSTTSASSTATESATASSTSTSQTTVASTTSESGTTTTETTPIHPADTDLGDVNADGKVDAKDASMVLVAYAKVSTGSEDGLTEKQRKAADVNADGKVDAKDASSILAYYALVSTSSGDFPTMKEYMAPKKA